MKSPPHTIQLAQTPFGDGHLDNKNSSALTGWAISLPRGEV